MRINQITLQRCPECETVVKIPENIPFQTAVCPNCHDVLRPANSWSLRRCSIIALAILILLPFALTFPLMSIDLLGVPIHATVWGGVWKMATEGYPYTAFMVLLCSVVFPIAFALLVLTIRLQRLLAQRPRYTLIFLAKIQEWVMLDVYLVALAVAAFKIRDYAALSFSVHLSAFVIVTILTTLLFIKINPKRMWEDFYPEYHTLLSGHQGNVSLCPTCEYTFDEQIVDLKGRQRCPRCESNLAISDNIKLQRVWASLIAGVVMMVPANILPISATGLAGSVSADTLFSGVLTFIGLGSYTVAAIVFIASIAVPFSKVAIILYLLLAIHYKWKHPIHWQMKALHYVHFVGRWSMLDLFVLALMMSLLERGQILSFSVGDAAFFFGAAVFLTMIASSNLDARMLWRIHYSNEQKA
ncbi:paraquat-inducible protein A [Actinobacillus genomosp. 1]|mgnify:CR=1 FL=1|uniref:paraquat-inducible protein A n=1 Tax=Actinobacillus genomosp. 1 TaxID=254839 RepID=UPI002441E1DA|nr:paraquat-inducible protein A [Actinobacillus genomosp. 1]WGE91183.1 paraquat-inducible protein A [Actinobacillus genomosp. 1]